MYRTAQMSPAQSKLLHLVTVSPPFMLCCKAQRITRERPPQYVLCCRPSSCCRGEPVGGASSAGYAGGAQWQRCTHGCTTGEEPQDQYGIILHEYDFTSFAWVCLQTLCQESRHMVHPHPLAKRITGYTVGYCPSAAGPGAVHYLSGSGVPPALWSADQPCLPACPACVPLGAGVAAEADAGRCDVQS